MTFFSSTFSWCKQHPRTCAIAIYTLLLVLALPFLYKGSGISQDDAAVILAALNLSYYKLFTFNLFNHLVVNLLNYSHGWVVLAATWLPYKVLNWVGLPLTNSALIFPSTFCVWLIGVALILWTYELKQRLSASLICVAVLFSFPIIIGLTRAYMMQLALAICVRTWLFLTLYWAVTRSRRRYKWLAFGIWALLIGSENAFYFSSALAVVWIYALHFCGEKDPFYVALWSSARKTFSFFCDPLILLPISVVALYVIAFCFEQLFSISNGFLSYPFSRVSDGISFGIPPHFLSRFIDHFGFGTLGFVSLILWTGFISFKGVSRKQWPIVAWLILWIGITLYLLCFYTPRNNAMHFLTLAAPPISILIALGVAYLWDRRPYFTSTILLFGLAANIWTTACVIYGWPYSRTQIYGTVSTYGYSDTLKAVGTLLRTEGYAPRPEVDQTQLDLRSSLHRLKNRWFGIHEPKPKRKLIPAVRPIVLAGNGISARPYPALLFWGTDVTDTPNATVEVVVAVPAWNSDATHWERVMQFAHQPTFGLKYVLVNRGKPTGEIYLKGYTGQPKQVSQFTLCQIFDRRYARMSQLKTPWAHAL